MNSSTPPFPVDSLEYRMFRAMRQTIEKITLERNGLREIQQSHYLNGTFRQLCDSATMVEVLYPGASADVLRNMPKNLKELLEWLDLELDLRELSVKAVEVLTNIKAKGAAKGEFMDKETENVLIPQISQESLSKGIIDAVRKLNRKVSATVASRMKLVADPESEKATKNQLLETTISFLIKEKFSFQQNFFGQDWVNYARKDVERFVKYEKMSAIDSQGNVMPKSSCVDESCGVNYICWIELDSFLKENYPALAEVVEELHCLPYELNANMNFPSFQLLEPGKGATMLIYYPTGSGQIDRVDSRSDHGDFDSGIRVSCSYNIVNNGMAVNSPNKDEKPTITYSLIENKNDSSKLTTDIPVEDDMLFLHLSSEVINGRRPSCSSECYTIVTFFHGKEDT